MPHPNERERVKYLIFLHPAVFWHQDRFMRGGKDRNNSTVTPLPHLKKTTPNSLPPLLSSSLAYLPFSSPVSALIYFSLSFLVLSWSSLFFCRFFFYLLFPQPRQLNELHPHFLHLSVCLAQPPPSPPSPPPLLPLPSLQPIDMSFPF